MLLCGPAGCGKARLARALGREAREAVGAPLLRLRTSELLASARLTRGVVPLLDRVFAEAAGRAPALVLVRGLSLLGFGGEAQGAIASEPTGRTLGGTAAAAYEVAEALLSRLRAAPPGVVVMGTARDPRSLPSCLFAHGGFESTRVLPPPSAEQRAALLRLWLPDATSAAATTPEASGAEAPISAAAHAEQLAGRTAGYTARGLRRLIAATSVCAVARAAAGGGDGGRPRLRDAEAALALTAPSAADRGAEPEASRAAAGAGGGGGGEWEGVGGYAPLRARLEQLVCMSTSSRGGLSALGVPPPSGALLYGAAGNGKTMLVGALARRCGLPILSVKGSELFGAYVGDTEAAIRELFHRARALAPSILMLDEIDALAGSRGQVGLAGPSHGGSSVAERALSTLLNEMDGVGSRAAEGGSSLEAPQPVFLVGCSNRPELVDAALIRPGRLEQLLLVGHPDEADRAAVLALHTARLPLAADVELAAVAGATERFSCAALAALCREAARLALGRQLRGGEDRAGGTTARQREEKEEEEEEEEDEESEEDEEDGAPLWARAVTQADEGALAVSVTAADLSRAEQIVRTAQVLPAEKHAEALAAFERFRER